MVTADALLDMAASAGLALVSLLGDYQGEPFDESSSPCPIAILEQRP